MRKFFGVLFILAIFAMPVFSGEYESALAKNKPVLLYMYTSYCKYCKQFEPIYSKLVKSESAHYTFVKTDAESKYGGSLMRQMRARYVPFVMLVDANKQYAKIITPDCLTDYSCMDNELKTFLK